MNQCECKERFKSVVVIYIYLYNKGCYNAGTTIKYFVLNIFGGHSSFLHMLMNLSFALLVTFALGFKSRCQHGFHRLHALTLVRDRLSRLSRFTHTPGQHRPNSWQTIWHVTPSPTNLFKQSSEACCAIHLQAHYVLLSSAAK